MQMISRNGFVARAKIILIGCCGFFLPWGGGLNVFGSYPPLLFIASVSLLALYLIKTGVKFPPLPVLVFILFIIANILTTIAIFGNDYLSNVWVTYRGGLAVAEGTTRTLSKIGFLLIFFFVYISIVRSRKEILVLMICFVLGLLSTCLIKWSAFLRSFPFDRFSGGYDDPNAFGLSAGMAFLFSMFAIKETKGIFKAAAFGLSLLCLVMMASSQSRGAWLALVFALLFTSMRRNIWNGLPFVLIGIILCFCSALLPERLSDVHTMIDYGGAGRTHIWAVYLSNIKEYFFIGVGFARADEITSEGIIGVSKIPHNFLLHTFVEFGMFGLIAVLWMLSSLWKGLFTTDLESEDRNFFIGLLLFWSTSTLFLSSIMFRETWLCWAILSQVALYAKHPASSVSRTVIASAGTNPR